MHNNNIRKSYLSISSPGIFLTPPSSTSPSDPATASAITLARRVNTYGSTLKRQHPSEFGFFASLPLPDIGASLAEIEFCCDELDVDGFVLLTNAYGMYLGDPAMAPIYELLDARKAVIFVHPTVPCTFQNAFSPSNTTSSSPSTQPIHAPSRLAANMPLSTSYAGPILEFLFDSTRSVSDLLLTGTAARYPGIRWIIPHCGATLPSVLDRVIRFSQLIPAKAGSERRTTPLDEQGVRELLGSRFFFDLAGLPMNSQVHHILRWTEYTRLLYGSDTPFTPWAMAEKVTGEVREALMAMFGGETGEHEIRSVCCGNAEELFGAGSK